MSSSTLDQKRVMLILPPTTETIYFANHPKKIELSAVTVIDKPLDGNLNLVARKRCT